MYIYIYTHIVVVYYWSLLFICSPWPNNALLICDYNMFKAWIQLAKKDLRQAACLAVSLCIPWNDRCRMLQELMDSTKSWGLSLRSRAEKCPSKRQGKALAWGCWYLNICHKWGECNARHFLSGILDWPFLYLDISSIPLSWALDNYLDVQMPKNG